MADKKNEQLERMKAYDALMRKRMGKAVRPMRQDGFINVINRYGTKKDVSEQYKFVPEPMVPDDTLARNYEGNGLFAKIIDTPAEEAVKHGFELEGVSDEELLDFCEEALDELDWEEVATNAIRWSRLFGGAIAVMLINDGGELKDPVNWKKIKSIDDIRVYDRSVVTPDYSSMYTYDPGGDAFQTRGSRLGMPEYYHVHSQYGNFTVHESRCLIFQNGVLPERTTNSTYQLWGMPEYIRIHRALRDAEIAHRSAPKMLDRSVQPVYKVKDLSQLLATEQGEDVVLKRLEVIDMARGIMNTIAVDSEGEEYDFRSFQYSGVADVIDATCNLLSAITSIPQSILFGRPPSGMSDTGESDKENFYNYIERIQKKMLKSNLRYLLSIIFQAGLATGEVDEVPKIKIKFKPLWSLSELEQADLEAKKAATDLVIAQTAQVYVDMQALDATEVRKKLADSSEFDINTILDEEDLDGDFMDIIEGEGREVTEDFGKRIFEKGDFDQYGEGVSLEEHETDPGTTGSAPASAPAATKLPQDMSAEEKAEVKQNADGDDPTYGSVGVLVINNGMVLSATRHNDFGYGLICGPGGHIEDGETPEEAAIRETEEEFGIKPTELIPLGRGPLEHDTGLRPHLFLCTQYEGEPECRDLEMRGAEFRTVEELDELAASMFQPFADGLKILNDCIETALFFGDDGGELHGELVDAISNAMNQDGGTGSGNHNHEGVPGKVGGSAKNGGRNNLKGKSVEEAQNELNRCGKGSKCKVKVYDDNSGREIADTFELDENGVWVSSGSSMSLSEEEMAHIVSSRETIEASLDVKSTADRVEPKGFGDRMELYVGGGYSTSDILEKDDIEFIKMNSEPTEKPMYRIEESRFTASDIDGENQEFSFEGDIRSFTRNPKVANSMLDENSDEYAYMDDPVVFKTSGTTQQFDVTPYASAYRTSQEESFVGGKFRVLSKSTYVTPEGKELPMFEIEQIGFSDRTDGGPGSGNHNHAGRVGKVGGSSGISGGPGARGSIPKKYLPDVEIAQGINKHRKAYLCSLGYDEKDVDAIERIAKSHASGSNVNQEATDFVHDNEALIRDVAQYEMEASKMRVGKEPEEITLYRQGDYSDQILSFTDQKDGAVLYKGTEHEQYLTPDHENTLKDLYDEGIVPISGYGAYTNFYGENEITFVNLNSAKNGKHSPLTVDKLNGADRKNAEAEIERIQKKQDDFSSEAMKKQQELFSKGDFSAEKMTEFGNWFNDNNSKIQSEVDAVSEKYGIVINQGGLKSTRQDGGPGSGNHNHKGVPGQVGGSAKSAEAVLQSFENYPRTEDLYKNVFTTPKNREESDQIVRYQFGMGEFQDKGLCPRKKEKVNLSQLSTTQAELNKSTIEYFANSEKSVEEVMSTGGKLPLVLKYGDTMVIADGNHRLSYAKASGAKEVEVEVADLKAFENSFSTSNNDADSINEIDDRFDGETNTFISENSLDFSRFQDTIKSKENLDGGPGSGRYPKGSGEHLSRKELARYKKAIIGMKTSDGIEITHITNHANERLAQRKIGIGRIKDALASPSTPGHTENTRCYEGDRMRIVVDKNNGNIVTVMLRNQNRRE